MSNQIKGWINRQGGNLNRRYLYFSKDDVDVLPPHDGEIVISIQSDQWHGTVAITDTNSPYVRQALTSRAGEERVLDEILAALQPGQDGKFDFDVEGRGRLRLVSPFEQWSEAVADQLLRDGEFDPTNTNREGRQRALREVTVRRGQPAFREALIKAYGGRCAISGCDAVSALEAAHITPYAGEETNSVQNGILLRADLHTLWDLGLIAIHETTGQVLLAHELLSTCYAPLNRSQARLPTQSGPSGKALKQHREHFGFAL